MEDINTDDHIKNKIIFRKDYNNVLRSIGKILLIFMLLILNLKIGYTQCECDNDILLSSDPIKTRFVITGENFSTEVPNCVRPIARYHCNGEDMFGNSYCYRNEPDIIDIIYVYITGNYGKSGGGLKAPVCSGNTSIDPSKYSKGEIHSIDLMEGDFSGNINFYFKPYTPQSITIDPLLPSAGRNCNITVVDEDSHNYTRTYVWEIRDGLIVVQSGSNRGINGSNNFDIELDLNLVGVYRLRVRIVNDSGENGIKEGCWATEKLDVRQNIGAEFFWTDPVCFGGNTDLTITCSNITATTEVRLNIDGEEFVTYNFTPSRRSITNSKNLGGDEYSYTIQLVPSLVQQGEGDFTVTHPSRLRITGTPVQDVNCTGGADGSITINAAGGTGTRRYSLNRTGPYSTNRTISGLAVGTYTVWVRDNKGCLASRSVTVRLSENFTINYVTAIDEKCVDANNGEIVFNVTGSNAPFQYSIDGGVNYSTNPTIGGLSPDTYNNFVVRDNHNCVKSYVGEVTVNPASPLIINSVSHQDVTVCSDSINGSITINVSGGAGGYVFIINGQEYASSPITGLGKGTYTISVRDANGCLENWPASVVVSGPPLLTINNVLETSIVGCKGDSSGAVEVNVSGGTNPLLYILIPEGGGSVLQGTPVFTELVQDLYYNIIVRDNNGCIANWVDTVMLDGPEGVLLDSVNTREVTACFYNSDGEIEIYAHGGTPELSYSINGDDDGNFQSENIFQGVSKGTYNVCIRDGKGCIQEYPESIHVNGPSEINVNPILPPETIECYGESTGRIFFTASGGTGILQYSIDAGATYQDSCDFSNLYAGDYTIRLRDESNCFIDTIIIVTQNSEIEILSIDVDNVTCFGENDGKIAVDIIGGVNPTFSVDNITYSIDTIRSLSPGDYDIRIRDEHSCLLEWEHNPVNISQPEALSFVDTTFILPSCTEKGDIIVEVIGGTPFHNGYDYILTNESTDTSFSLRGYSVIFENVIDYISGLYTLEVVDSNHCSVKDVDDWVITVDAGQAIEVADSVIINPTCYGGSDGSIEVLEVTGGSGTYDIYQWSRLEYNDEEFSGQEILNLNYGPYSLTITDDEGCTSNGIMFMVNDPPQLEIVSNITDVTCIGDNNGSIEITGIENGVPEYIFEWADSTGTGIIQQDTSIQNNLTTGIYKITVTDSQACEIQDIITVNDPEIIVASIISDNNYDDFDVPCFGDLGSVTAHVTGGAGSYSFAWSNGIFTEQSIGLEPGIEYTVTVTDANNCTDTTSIILTEPDILIASIDRDSLFEGIYHVRCFGDEGSATAIASGGLAPYNYLWSDGTEIQQSIGLDAGTECFVIVSDNYNCKDTAYTILRQPEELHAIITPDNIYNGYHVACYGNEGSATASGSGGFAPYDYVWSNGETTETAILQSEIEYVVTITDQLQCFDTTSIILDAPNSFQISIESDTNVNGYDINCFGDLGSATAYGVDGVPPYTYEWSTGDITPQATSLQSGIEYSVTMTDANGCTAVGSIILSAPDSLYISAKEISNIICKNENSGSIDLDINGGVGNYNFLWTTLDGSGLEVLTEDQLALSAGKYMVNISDENSCTIVDSTILTEPEIALNIAITNQIDVNCNSYFNGSITLEATEGWGNHTFSKDGFSYQASDIFDHLPAAQYDLFVKDQGGCVDSVETEITQPDTLSANIVIESVISCSGGGDGRISVTTTGGSLPYRYSIDDGYTIQQSGVFDQLTGGSYSVLIIDNNNCTLDKEVDILQPQQIELTILSIDEATCSNADGDVLVEASAGTSPYMYEWKDLAVFVPELTNVFAGTYELTVTDNSGCENIFYVDINNSDGPAIAIAEINDASCYNASDGSVSINVTEGVQPYQFVWNDPLAQTSNEATGLAQGTYTVTVTDGNACEDQLAIEIGPENEISIDFIVENVTCKGGSDAFVSVHATNGTSPYNYIWKNEFDVEIGTDSIITDLSAGKYIVEVWDANNCPNGLASPGISDTVIISEPYLPLEIEAVDKAGATCYGASNGWVQVSGTGGHGLIEYSDDNMNYSSTALFSNLSEGNTEIFARDENACVTSVNVYISQPEPLVVLPYLITHVSCNGNNDAQAVLMASGGSSPYYYRIDGVEEYSRDSVFNNLAAGIYTMYVRDENNCEESCNIEIIEPTVLNTEVIQINGSTCGFPDGNATIEASGGTQPYSYQWDDEDEQLSSRVYGLLPGIYHAIVSDANHCVDTIELEIESIPGPEIEIQDIHSISCVGDTDGIASVIVNGGAEPYTVEWNDPLLQTGLLADNLSAGTYQVIATDMNICSDTLEVIIPSVDTLRINLEDLTSPVCNGDVGNISVSATGGTFPYLYLWDNGETTSDISSLNSGIYNLTVIDIHNCIANDSYNITGGEEEVIVDIPESAIVCGGQTVTVDAGHPDASHLWYSANGFSSSDQIVELEVSGTYTVIVTNSNGCEGSAEFELEESNNSLDAGILMVDEAFVGDTVIVYELSWPIPDSIIWEIPSAFEILGEDIDHKYLFAKEPGKFIIAMTAFYNDCIGYTENSLEILAGESKEASELFESQEGEGVVKLVEIYPNPTTQFFTLKVTLIEENDVEIELCNLLGLPIFKDHDFGKTEYTFNYNVDKLEEGLYLLVIKTAGYKKVIRLIKN